MYYPDAVNEICQGLFLQASRMDNRSRPASCTKAGRPFFRLRFHPGEKRKQNRSKYGKSVVFLVSGIVRQGRLDFLMQIPFPDTVVADGNCLGAILIHEKRQQQDTGHQRVNPFRLIEQDQIYSILIVFAQASGQRFQLLPVEGSAVLRQRRNRSLRFS